VTPVASRPPQYRPDVTRVVPAGRRLLGLALVAGLLLAAGPVAACSVAVSPGLDPVRRLCGLVPDLTGIGGEPGYRLRVTAVTIATGAAAPSITVEYTALLPVRLALPVPEAYTVLLLRAGRIQAGAPGGTAGGTRLDGTDPGGLAGGGIAVGGVGVGGWPPWQRPVPMRTVRIDPDRPVEEQVRPAGFEACAGVDPYRLLADRSCEVILFTGPLAELVTTASDGTPDSVAPPEHQLLARTGCRV
jgi:hypothetical protein